MKKLGHTISARVIGYFILFRIVIEDKAVAESERTACPEDVAV
jgi:hypothetical protein